MHRLVLGGEKCGKSAYAMGRFLEEDGPHRLLVTGKALDLSFRRQIETHRRERSPDLFVQEVAARPDALPAAILAAAEDGVASLLVDSMDFWLFGVVGEGCQESDIALDAPLDALLHALAAVTGRMRVTFVSCEVGLGPVAASAATRRFVRGLGACNQALAQHCQHVILIAAGLPLALKGQA